LFNPHNHIIMSNPICFVSHKEVSSKHILGFYNKMASECRDHRGSVENKNYNKFFDEWHMFFNSFLINIIQMENFLYLFHPEHSKIPNPSEDLLSIMLPFKTPSGDHTQARKDLEGIYEIMLKRLFVVEFGWHAEYFLKNAASILGISPEKTGYFNYANYITEKLNFNDNFKTRDSLVGISYIRNTLHGGVFKSKDTTIHIAGKPYFFKQGQEVDLFYWDTIILFAYECMKSLQLIHNKIHNNN